MFKKIFKTAAAGITGFIVGTFEGPFAAVGKLHTLIQNDIQKSGSGQGASTAYILGTPFFFTAGLLYGPIRGCQLAIKEGLKKNLIQHISRELFSYQSAEKKVPLQESQMKTSYQNLGGLGIAYNDKNKQTINNDIILEQKIFIKPVMDVKPKTESRLYEDERCRALSL